MRAHTTARNFSLQETRSWDVPNWKLLGYVCVVAATSGSPLWWFRIGFSKKKEILEIKRVFVMAMLAPDCHKDLDVNETFIKDVTKVLLEGRRAGAKTFYIAGDLNVELGLLCTGDDDVEELTELYGPFCWQGCENDQGGVKKLV